MSIAVLATCNLNQWAMDFEGNLTRIRRSIDEARCRHARYRLGPELEVSGYGCEDHFLERDTFIHTWECIAALIQSGHTDNIFVDIGAAIWHHDVAYNCRLLILNRQILLIRPKADLADDGNYRESRWFRQWPLDRPMEQYRLPSFVYTVCASSSSPHVPIGHAIVELSDGFSIACETCEELWTPASPNITLFLAGTTIIGNGSGSHHTLRKRNARLEILQSTTRKSGGIYLYANQQGCDGGRLYYDGCALAAMNGDILAIGSQFSLVSEVEVVTVNVDLDDVATYRAKSASRGVQGSRHQTAHPITRISSAMPFTLLHSPNEPLSSLLPTRPIEDLPKHSAEQEIALGPACWLWDYLRRSGLSGFFLPLSGGADSAATAAIVGAMCQLIVSAVHAPNPNETLIRDVCRVANLDEEEIAELTSRKLANCLLHTMYMPCGDASSLQTRQRAKDVAEDIGAYHMVGDITGIVSTVIALFSSIFGERCTPRFRTRGGSMSENVALQNVQARVRMVFGYLCAQLLPWVRGRNGSLLVLGSANVDESLRGYLTKYDCSAADINPIGGVSKQDLRMFLQWAAKDVTEGVGLGYSSLEAVVRARPTAELEPIEDGYEQTDEEDMGMSYNELCRYGRLRKMGRCGPLSMFRKLCVEWGGRIGVTEVARKVKFFFRMYCINRHKLTTLTPSYHAENYSPDDNRYDLRQFLYDSRWTWQFARIDDAVRRQCDSSGEVSESTAGR